MMTEDKPVIDWTELAKGSRRLWPQPDEQTVRGHLDVSHGGYADAPNPDDVDELLAWHRGTHENHGDELRHHHEGELDTEVILNCAIDRLPAKWQWFYAAYDDKLGASQVQQLFASDDGEMSIIEDIEMNSADYRHDRMWEVVEEAVPDEEELEALRDDESMFDRLREAIWERDESDIIGELADNTRLFLRYRLGDTPGDYNDLEPNSWNWGKREIYNAARRLAKIAGIPWKGNEDRMRELVVNATYGGELFVFWYGGVKDLIDATVRHYGGYDKPQTITWTNPTLLVLDYYNGSGHEVALEGTYSRPFDPERLVVDSAGSGYGWDAVCGLSSGYYSKIGCEITEGT